MTTPPNNERTQWVKIALTIVCAAGVICVQWGMVITKLDAVQTDVSSIRQSTADLDSRVSYIEGKIGSRKEANNP